MPNVGKDIFAFVVAAVMIWGPMALAARKGHSESINPTEVPITTGTVAPQPTTN